MALSWTYRAHSEIGLVRKNNQDSGFVGAHLLLVADGMGGAAAGDLASAVAVDSIKTIDTQVPDDEPADDDPGGDDPGGDDPGAGPDGATRRRIAERNLSLLTNSMFHANSRIADLASADYTLEGMGTTVTAALLDHDQLSLAHIGDSRAYLLRDGRLERLTHDHTWVQSLVDDGKITEAEAVVHPHRSLLLKVLNGQPANEPDLTTLDLRAGDRLLFCSDGLCGFVDDDEIGEDLALPDLDQAMERMIDAAHRAGGLDNITIIIAEFGPADVASGEPRGEPTGEATVLVTQSREPEILGAAAEAEIPSTDTIIRSRPASMDAVGLDDDDPDGSPDDEDRYAPQPPARRHLGRPLVGLLVVLLVLGAGLGAGFAWSRTQYFVGNDDGQVAIFQGVSGVPSGLGLSRVYEVQQLPVSALPPLYQQMVNEAIDVADLPAARATVQQLREAAAQCERQHATPSGSPTPKPSATATAGTKASATPGPTSKSTTKATPKPTRSSSASANSTGSPSTALSGQPSATASGVLPPGGQTC